MSTKTRRALDDAFGRTANYLRVSITDRCNFNCVYCRGDRRRQEIPHASILRYEEIIRLAEITTRMGIGKMRVTGGEPFARKDCIQLLWRLRRRFPDLRLCVTSNGSLIEPHLKDLAALKLESINISLDSFDRQTFKKLTGRDALPLILSNIDQLIGRGCSIKLNAVALKGVTDQQISDFIYAAKTMPLDLRFIEFMPMGSGTVWNRGMFLAAEDILNLAKEFATLEAAEASDIYAGPAKIYNIAGGKGRIGFISALTNHFCASCNRMRITSDGNLRACLFADKEYRLAPLLRNSKIKDAVIADVIQKACMRKKMGITLLENKSGAAVAQRAMTGIGG